MSGAGSIKDDGSDDEHVYEIKDARRSHTLIAAALKGLLVRAIRQGKQPVYVVYFSDDDLTIECRVIPGRRYKP